MKILLVGDQHFRYELPYASMFEDGRKKEWEAVKKVIHKEADGCDAVILLGDGLNARHNNSSVIKEFIEFLNGFRGKEVHILVGNHEKYSSHTALDFLKKIEHPNWHIYSEPELTTVAGKKTMMIPYMTPALLDVATKEEGLSAIESMFPDKADLAAVHFGITGAESHGVSMEILNEIILNKEVMGKHFSYTVAGHIHQEQRLSSHVRLIGNIFTNEIGDHTKSILTLDFIDGTDAAVETLIPLPVRGIHKVIWESSGWDTKDGKWCVDADKKALSAIPNYSIVKCYVTSRETDLNVVSDVLKRFDASIIIEQYPSERVKAHFEEGGLDLSIDGLLKLYADAKNISYTDIQEGYDIVKQT